MSQKDDSRTPLETQQFPDSHGHPLLVIVIKLEFRLQPRIPRIIDTGAFAHTLSIVKTV